MSDTLLILTGPSASGKTVIGERLCARGAGHVPVERVVTATSRAPRANEVDGVDYHFLQRESFVHVRDGGIMLECDEHYGNFYGTPDFALAAVRSRGALPLLVLDVNGTATWKREHPDLAYALFLTPTALDDPGILAAIEGRIRHRQPDLCDDEVRRRVSAASAEIASARMGQRYDAVVVNANGLIEKAYAEVCSHVLRRLGQTSDVQVSRTGRPVSRI